MAQLNVHVPASSDLLARVEAAAQRLGTTPSALARIVLDVALEPYVEAQLELLRREQAYSSRVVAALNARFSGALPARPFVAPEDAADEEANAGGEANSDVAAAVGRVRRARGEVAAAPRPSHTRRRAKMARQTRGGSAGPA